MRNIRVGVVGAGHLGKIHTRVYSELPQAELVAVIDSNKMVADEVAAKYGVKPLYHHHDAIGMIEAVSVAVPTANHFTIAKDLIEAGMHVIVEKPMTKSIEESAELVSLSKKHNIVLQVGHVERFNPAILAVREYIHNPKFIECDRISPFSFRSMDIGVVLDMMIHDLDIVLAFVHSNITEIEAMGVNVLGPLEDMASARISFENGCIAYLRASRISRKRMRKIRVFQEDSYISLDYSAQKAQVYKKGEQFTVEKLAELRESLPSAEEAQKFIFGNLLNVHEINVEPDEPLKIELESFLQSIIEGKEAVVSGDVALKTMEITSLILESIKQRKRICPNAQSHNSCR
ncbi:MAG: Gfo/Idh/MocA family oxidoreductase [Planctomycetota bacterium]